MACRLSCLFALFSKTWQQQQQSPLAIFLVVVFVVCWGLAHFYCYDAYFVTPEIETFFVLFCVFLYFVIYCIGLRVACISN